jgi:hypothetical protein
MASPPDNCKLTVGSNIKSWVISVTGAEGTIYAGEQFKLKLVFPKEYPSKPPSVYYLKPTPKHVHVYSNGDICLNLLGRDWRPTMTAQVSVKVRVRVRVRNIRVRIMVSNIRVRIRISNMRVKIRVNYIRVRIRVRIRVSNIRVRDKDKLIYLVVIGDRP